MQAPTHMPGEAPSAPPSPPQAESREIAYLRDATTGKEFPWSEQLAERDGMIALDADRRVVPNAPMMAAGSYVDPNADPNPSINGVMRVADGAALQKQIDTLRGEVARLQTELMKLAG